MFLYIVSLVVILRIWVCDNWVYQLERLSDIKEVTAQSGHAPAPAGALVSRWDADPYSRGSYSFRKKGWRGDSDLEAPRLANVSGKKKQHAFGKPCFCVGDTRHFRHFRRFGEGLRRKTLVCFVKTASVWRTKARFATSTSFVTPNL